MKPVHLFSVAAALVIGSTSLPASVEAQQTVIRIGSRTPPKSGTVKDGFVPWLRQVEKDANGALKFQEFWGGVLERSLKKQYEALQTGLYDAAQVLPSYTASQFPDFTLFALPFLFNSPQEGSEAAWRFYKTGMMRGMDKLHIFTVYINDNGGLHFRDKLKSIADIKGLKIRAAGPQEAKTIRIFGGAPVSMGMGQVTGALNRGVIKGLLSGYSAVRTFRVGPLIKTHVDLPLGVRSFLLLMMKEKYDKLPAPVKAALDKNSGLKLSQRLGQVQWDIAKKVRAEAAKKNFIAPKGTQLAGLRKRFQTLHDDWIKNTPDGQKKYDALQKILADIRKRK